MPTKAELVKEIYLLLAVIHLHDFKMSPEMAQRIFNRWPTIIPDRPESPEDIINNYNDFLRQRPVDSIVKTEKPKALQSQKIVKGEKDEPSPFRLSNYSIKPKLEPKSNNHSIKAEPKPDAKLKTTTPRAANLDSPLPTYKKEPIDQTSNKPFTTTKRKPITKRVFVDLTDDISSDDDEDETLSKKVRIG